MIDIMVYIYHFLCIFIACISFYLFLTIIISVNKKNILQIHYRLRFLIENIKN